MKLFVCCKNKTREYSSYFVWRLGLYVAIDWWAVVEVREALSVATVLPIICRFRAGSCAYGEFRSAKQSVWLLHSRITRRNWNSVPHGAKSNRPSFSSSFNYMGGQWFTEFPREKSVRFIITCTWVEISIIFAISDNFEERSRRAYKRNLVLSYFMYNQIWCINKLPLHLK